MDSSDDVPLGNTTAVYFSNTSEDVWPFIQAMSDERARAAEIEENAQLADRDLFSLADYPNLVFVTPQSLSREFLEYYSRLFNGRPVPEVLVPKNHTGRICRDVLEDRQAFARLRELGKAGPLTLLSYSSSRWFYDVVEELRDAGVTVHLPQAPEEENTWTVNLFGSKTGIRQLIQQLHVDEPLARMSPGFIVNGIDFASKVAASAYQRNGGVVLKTQKGHAGVGVMIIRKGELTGSFTDIYKAIKEKLSHDEYWRKFPLVVEDYVDTDESVSGGFPNAEFCVTADGTTDFLYTGGMRVTKAGVFQGMEIHESVISRSVLETMRAVGEAVGREYAVHGYRGYFDIDFAAAKDGTLFVTESNVRRTGGTHVYHAAKSLVGPDFLRQTFILSNNTYPLPEGSVIKTFPQLLASLDQLLFNPQTQEGIVVCGENLLEMGKIAYLIFGRNREAAYDLEKRMAKALAA